MYSELQRFARDDGHPLIPCDSEDNDDEARNCLASSQLYTYQKNEQTEVNELEEIAAR